MDNIHKKLDHYILFISKKYLIDENEYSEHCVQNCRNSKNICDKCLKYKSLKFVKNGKTYEKELKEQFGLESVDKLLTIFRYRIFKYDGITTFYFEDKYIVFLEGCFYICKESSYREIDGWLIPDMKREDIRRGRKLNIKIEEIDSIYSFVKFYYTIIKLFKSHLLE